MEGERGYIITKHKEPKVRISLRRNRHQHFDNDLRNRRPSVLTGFAPLDSFVSQVVTPELKRSVVCGGRVGGRVVKGVTVRGSSDNRGRARASECDQVFTCMSIYMNIDMYIYV